MKIWNTVEREIMEFISEVDNPIRIDYGFKYSGTLPLDFDTFPAETLQEEAEGSNIKTSYDTDDLDNPTKWILYPTKKYGKDLSESEVDLLLEKNEHFGIYDSYSSMKEADNNIKKHFKDLDSIKIAKSIESPRIRIVNGDKNV
tara:strand:- start:2130 stop:2561 length:432 start_codon:yes stop_codon:yes gene_type:complete